MAPFGLKRWENAIQTIPHITFFDAQQFFLDVYLGFDCGLKNLRKIGKSFGFWHRKMKCRESSETRFGKV